MDLTLIHHYTELALTWIGFGVVNGLLAKAILPGRDPGGTIITMILGLGGSLIGTSIYAYAGGDHIRDMISPIGFGIAIGGAIVLLLAHRLFSGRILNLTDEGEYPLVPSPHLTAGQQRRKPKRRVVYEND